MKKIFLSTILSLVVVLGFAQPKIRFDQTTYNFGDVLQSGGPVTGRFEFTNVGDSALILTQVKASCGCTTPSYSREAISPGDRGFIDATYRPGSPAPFNKSITVTTNEPESNKTTLFIKGTVVKDPPTVFEQTGYTEGAGMVRIKSAKKALQMLNTEVRVDTFFIRNFQNKSMEIQPIEFPGTGHINAIYNSFGTELKKDEEGILVIRYDAGKAGMFGEVIDEIIIKTNDSILPEKKIYYNVTIKEDFSALSEKKLEKAPKIELDNANLNFGKLKINEAGTQTIKITNTGKSKLTVHRIYSSNPNIIVSLPPTIIAPKKSISVNVIYKSEQRAGRQKADLKIISNDPNQDVFTIQVEAEVAK